MSSGRKAVGAIRYLVNARSLRLEWAKVLHGDLLVPVLVYESETKKDLRLELLRRWITLVAFLGTRRIDRMLIGRITEF